MRIAICIWLLGCLTWLSAAAEDAAVAERRLTTPGAEPRASSPLARDIERRLHTSSRDIERTLSLEQSRLNARSATALQRGQSARNLAIARQRLNTLKTRAPEARSIPLLERRLDRVSRGTGGGGRSLGLGSGRSSSLGLSGSTRGR